MTDMREGEQGRLIDRLDLPAGLRSLEADVLRRVAGELREEIIATIGCNGGHLGSSLGAVELAVALHVELDTPRDAIVWDVGHQAYAHKLLTGRLDAFRTIRTYGGLSGFPCRQESPFDVYGTGHSSTSISAALGILEARRREDGLPPVEGEARSLRPRPGRVVAVIGDGALTGGMAYEALNHAGHLGHPLLVVLNDNAMSIEPNVGAISSYLSRLRLDPTLYRLRRDLERRLQRLPGLGEKVASMGIQLKEAVKAALVPGMLFEELGFTYVGVVDGHDIQELRTSLRRALALDGPVLLHCRTIKGRGYAPAERHPGRYHGIPPSADTCENGQNPEGPTTYTRAFGEALVQLAERDDRIVGITAAMARGTGLDLLQRAYPERFFDVGIAEAHAVGFAAGLAAQGKRPVVAIYSTFLQRAYDQIIQDVCLQGLPVVFAVDRAGLVGEDGPTHHGSFDLSFLRIIPNLAVFVPKDEAELQRLLATALVLDCPSVIRYPRSAGVGVPLPSPILPLEGPWIEPLRWGNHVAILALGPAVRPAQAAAELLAKQGVEATVVNVRRVRPLDLQGLQALAQQHEALLTVEDNSLAGGFGSAVLEALSEVGPLPRFGRIGLPDAFVGQGPLPVLRQHVGLDPQNIAYVASSLLGRPHPGHTSEGN
jgi:1-deoxy-D-xylulose-5-phosphate synthase